MRPFRRRPQGRLLQCGPPQKAALREAVTAYFGALAPEHRHHFRFDIIEVTLVVGKPGAMTHHTAGPLFTQRRR